MSHPILIVAAALVLFAGAIFLIKKLSAASPTDNRVRSDADYVVKPSVLSPAERSFFGVLRPLLPLGVDCLIKVRLGDVFALRKDLGTAERARAWNRIGQKHVDFLLVQSADLKPLAGIELDDSSHEREDRRQRDALVDEIFQSSKVPLLHVKVRETYNPESLSESLNAVLRRAESSST